jgi:PASTA domain
MTRRRVHAINSTLLVIGLVTVLGSCGGATSAVHTATPSGSGTPNSDSSSGHPVSPGGPVSSGHPTKGGPTTATSTTVPDVESQPVQEAIQNLRQAGLAVGTQKHANNLNVPNMAVIATDPAVGSPEPTGFAVNLLVSTGPPFCPNCAPYWFPMPVVVGQTLYQAETTLAEQSLSLDSYSFQESPTPKGIVIQSTPLAGALTNVYIGVRLVISSGPATSHSTSPSASPSTTSPSGSPSVSPSPTAPSISPSP